MTTSDDIEAADRAGRRRARMTSALAVIFLLQQAVFFVAPPVHLARPVDQVKVGAWVCLSVVLIAFLATGGMWRHRSSVRALLNDDAVRANRAEAMSLGFLVAMATALLLSVFAGVTETGLREAIHLIVSGGIVAALLRFGFLERRGFD